MERWTVVFRIAARRDLLKLSSFIAEQTGQREIALRYVQRIVAQCEALAYFPHRGIGRDDIRENLHLLPFEKRVVIAYRIDKGYVRIVRIFYGGRDYEALLRDQPAK